MSQTMETNMLDLIYLGLKKIVFSAHKSFVTVPLSSALSTSVHVPGKKMCRKRQITKNRTKKGEIG